MDDEQDISDRGPARAAPRDSLFLLTTLTTPDGAQLGKARVRNLSATGLMADCERAVPSGIKIICELRGIGPVAGSVAWSREEKIGIAFDEPIDPQLARKPVGSGAQKANVPDYLRMHQRGTIRR
ncbi:pilus assembly protein PilZ [Sphingobium sp. Leaf26]|uniref:PilZ domain-containing protein n=1 Tax=Sphingobium sp. Leaf26 TaxID=1735693 RepID=UPI000701AB1F|nr:PilZ domain-containing protein [Sphingobium sp. Leaf26]KQN00827.1 pilus assembly protein PilZ [Sphingobium sp. Leaf26]